MERLLLSDLQESGGFEKYCRRSPPVLLANPPLGRRAHVPGWLNHSRLLSKEYERLTRTDKTWTYVTMTRIIAKRLA